MVSADEYGEVNRNGSSKNDNRVDITPAAPAYPTRLDLQRFQKLLDAEEISTIASEPSVPAAVEHQTSAQIPEQRASKAERQVTERPRDPKTSMLLSFIVLP